MKIQKKQFRILAILILLTMAPGLAKKGGNGGKPGGGDDTCSSDFWPNDQLILDEEGAVPLIDGLEFDGFRLGRGLAAVDTGGGNILIAVAGSSSPDIAEAFDRLVILSYDGSNWSVVHNHEVIDIDSPGLKAKGRMKFADLDDDGYLDDLLFGSGLTNSAAVIYDVDSASPVLVELVKPTEAEGFGWGIAFDGSYIYVGAPSTNRGDGAVYIYAAPLTPPATPQLGDPGVLTPPIDGEGRFGTSLTVDANYLYVSAPVAAFTTSRQSRDSGVIFRYSAPAAPLSLPYDALSRDIKGEQLGHQLAMANGTDLVALPGGDYGESVALFWNSRIETVFDLVFTPERGQNFESLSTGNLNLSGTDEVVFRGPGGVLLYEDPSDSFQPQPLVLKPPDCGPYGFGQGLAIAGGYLFVGEPNRDHDTNDLRDGQIYVFSYPLNPSN